MIRLLSRILPISVALGLAVACTGTGAPPSPSRASFSAFPIASDHLMIAQDFNSPGAWSELSATGAGVTALVKPVGTIDIAKTTTPSQAVELTIPAKANAINAAITSGLLPVRNKETDLGKLTLSFDHSVSAVSPVTVRIESFDRNRKRTGGREAVVYPAAPDFYLRSALELSMMKPFGAGQFQPSDPFVQIRFQVSRPPSAEGVVFALRIDNVSYASPAFYVSPNGSDKNDGRTEKTAFADPQKAVDAAQPGDIILLMDGVYHRVPTSSIHEGIVGFHHAGTPAAWISLKNYPGQHPIFQSDGWNAIKIGRGTKEKPCLEPALAYLEVRGLHIRGNADTIKEQHPELVDQPNPLTNGNGISMEGRSETNVPHHLRFADNLVEYCSGGGISGIAGDWITVENNTVRNNCWWMIYAGSGISFLDSANFDAVDNVYKSLIRGNNVSGNQCFVKWRQVGKFSDGNGIIVDTNYVPAKNQIYLGRTLVQNNLSFNNGGSGIHAFLSHRVDIVNNTAYYNGAAPALRWGQIFVQVADDVRLMNNILVSRPDQPINSVGKDSGDQKSTNVVRANNIYFGGLAPKIMGENDVITDPLFVNASTDFKVADFHVKTGSPALKSGWQGPILPLLDLDGKPRPTTTAPDRGAYQQEVTHTPAVGSVAK